MVEKGCSWEGGVSAGRGGGGLRRGVHKGVRRRGGEEVLEGGVFMGGGRCLSEGRGVWRRDVFVERCGGGGVCVCGGGGGVFW